MVKIVAQILDSRRKARGPLAALALVLLSACGQKGPLYLPTEPVAQGRATLPQSLNPSFPAPPASAPGVTGTANPIHEAQ
jgi:predicted small lipoprotein YifL